MNRKEKVYAFLSREARVPLTEEEIAAILDVPKKDRFELALILEELHLSGQILCHKGRYAVKKSLSDADMLSSILESHDFPSAFPDEVLSVSDDIPAAAAWKSDRTDLRSLLTFTIDGADARDLDDAISIEPLGDGYRLYVHIADVSHYVKNNDPIDREAYRRGTSCYLPDRVVPMLPPSLSNGICSLHPHVDRLTLTTRMDLSADGQVKDASIFESVIRSDARLIYEDVASQLEKNAPDPGMEEVFPSLVLLQSLCHALRMRRKEKGSIDLSIPEPYVVLGEGGHIADITLREDTVANHMIEECMVLCNRTVAEYMYHLNAPFVYRVHEAPDVDKLERLSDALLAFGLSIPGKFSGQKATALLDSITDSTKQYVVSTLLLRSMMRAAYRHENLGHFGLALPFYCHFTSPIRRYPDLLCHRAIKAVLHGQDTGKLARKVRRAALFSSEREEAAQEAEREAVRYLMCRYMEAHIGEEFDAVISSVQEFGFFVALPSLVEGLVHVKDLGDDYYIYDGKAVSLTGKESGKRFCLGDKVRVRLVRVDSTLSHIDFELKGDETTWKK